MKHLREGEEARSGVEEGGKQGDNTVVEWNFVEIVTPEVVANAAARGWRKAEEKSNNCIVWRSGRV